MQKLTKIFLCIFSLIAVVCTISYAAVPHLLNYQGRLTDKSGRPLEGSYSLTFRIYDQETAGNLLWQETHQGVVIQKGLFSVLLGSIAGLNNLAFDKQYYLEIKVGDEVMSPRQLIAGSAYAIKAEMADTLTGILPTSQGGTGTSAAANVANGVVVLDASSRLPAVDASLLTNVPAHTSAAGDVLVAFADKQETSGSDSYVKVKEIKVAHGGVFRIKFEMSEGGGAERVVYARIYRNGVAVGTERSIGYSGNNWISYSEDISGWSPGDLCQLYIYKIGWTDVSIRNFRIYSSSGLDYLVLLD